MTCDNRSVQLHIQPSLVVTALTGSSSLRKTDTNDEDNDSPINLFCSNAVLLK